MTRDSAPGSGSETGPEHDVTENPGTPAVESPAADSPTVEAPAAETPTVDTVAVDTTEGEPGDTSDATDEGAVVAASDHATTPVVVNPPAVPVTPAPVTPAPATSIETAELIEAAGPAGPAEPGEPGETLQGGAPVEKHSTLVPLVGTLVALAAIAAILIGAMALPIAKAKPSGVPVGVAGSTKITSQLTTLMQQFGGEGTFDVHVYTTSAAMKDAIEDREVYGGLYVDNSSATMLVATAAGIKVSDALQTVATTLQSQAQVQVTVTDVVAQPTEDPRGDGLATAELPLALIATLPAFGLILLYRRRPLAQLGGAVLGSAAVGLAVAAVLNYGSGSTSGGNYWLLAAGLAAGVFATSTILIGLYALAGRIGLGVATAVLVLFGAPLSGLSSVPEWLPSPWGTLGQLLPPGATATVIRSMAFFGGAGSKSALLVFLLWILVGLLLLGLGTTLHRSNERLAELRAEEEAAQQELDGDDEKAPATV